LHDLEPHYNWRDRYIASEDKRSPFYGYVNNEFQYENKIYNYFIHPQWDHFGSKTLYMKVIFVDYETKFAVIELIGEWNDCLHNDIMFLKREIIDLMQDQDIQKYAVVCENVLNFHGSDDCYYEEWFEDVMEYGGWICFINLLDHVCDEMRATNIHAYVTMGGALNTINWRAVKPNLLCSLIETLKDQETKAMY
jgi:hypothetical protein